MTSRPQLRPLTVKSSHMWRQPSYEVDRCILTDNAELFLKADETDRSAIRLEPARLAVRVPTLLASGAVGQVDGNGEQILNRRHGILPRKKEEPNSAKESPAQLGTEAGLPGPAGRRRVEFEAGHASNADPSFGPTPNSRKSVLGASSYELSQEQVRERPIESDAIASPSSPKLSLC